MAQVVATSKSPHSSLVSEKTSLLEDLQLQQSKSSHYTPRLKKLFPAMTLLTLVLLAFLWGSGCVHSSTDRRLTLATTTGLDNTASRRDTTDIDSQSPLKVIQVHPPVRFNGETGNSTASCKQTIVVHSFVNSYGKPFVGPYTPPNCQFNRIIWNLSVASAGRQFDRLGSVWLGDVEVFRTSTAEPTQTGIEWTYLKDVSPYLTLFKQQQTIIFDLANIVNNIYTAPLNVTLTATYYNVDSHVAAADVILPLSTGSTTTSSAFTFPAQNVTSAFAIPQNAVKAVFTIAATGQSNEEFWWSNVLQQDINDFPAFGATPGYSPFREVQLFIDGTLAGVVWPFPIIFTGGVVPGLWRPLVGIDAYDLKEDEIDLTPWLPYLSDGKQHVYSIKVSGLAQSSNGTAVLSETVDSYWIVSGKLFLWLDTTSVQINGSAPSIVAPPPTIEATSHFYNSSNANDTALNYQVNVTRQIMVKGVLNTSSGEQQTSWIQSLQYIGEARYSEGGNLQYNYLHITGHDTSSSGYDRTISYPLNATTLTTTDGDNYTISASIERGQRIEVFGPTVFPTGLESYEAIIGNTSAYGALLDTTQNGQASYVANTTASTSFSFGETDQQLTFSAVSPNNQPAIQLYYRDVEAANGSFVEDKIIDNGHSPMPEIGRMATWEDMTDFVVVDLKSTVPGEG